MAQCLVTMMLLLLAETVLQAQCGARRSCARSAPTHSADKSIRRDSMPAIVGTPRHDAQRRLQQARQAQAVREKELPDPAQLPPPPSSPPSPPSASSGAAGAGGFVASAGSVLHPSLFDAWQQSDDARLIGEAKRQVISGLIGSVPKIVALLLFVILQIEVFYWISRVCVDEDLSTRFNAVRAVCCVNFAWPILGGAAFLVALLLLLNLAIQMQSALMGIVAILGGVVAALFVLFTIFSAIYEEELIPTLGMILLPVPVVALVVLPISLLAGYVAMGEDRRELMAEFVRELDNVPSAEEPGAVLTRAEAQDLRLQFIRDFQEQLPLRERIQNGDFEGMTLEERIALEQHFAGQASRLKQRAQTLSRMPAHEKDRFRRQKESLEKNWKAFRQALNL